MVLRDTIFYVNNENEQAAILCIDQEKAFDKIKWKYMFDMMEKMGIPKVLNNWVKNLYSNPFSIIIVISFITEPNPWDQTRVPFAASFVCHICRRF